jgi:hypothetical protein
MSRGSSRGSSSTTSPRASLLSATSPMMCDRVPRLLSRLVIDLGPSRRSTSRQSVALAFAARSLRLASRLLVTRLHRLYYAYAMHLDAPCRRSTSHRSVALAPAMRQVTLSRGSTTLCPAAMTSSCGHSGSTSAMLCVATTCLATTPPLLRVRRLSVVLHQPLISTNVARRHNIVFWSYRVDPSSRLVFQTSRERQSHPQQLVGVNSD